MIICHLVLVPSCRRLLKYLEVSLEATFTEGKEFDMNITSQVRKVKFIINYNFFKKNLLYKKFCILLLGPLQEMTI